jgi:hypothetical protein
VLKMLAVRNEFHADREGTKVIHTLRAGDTVRGLQLRVTATGQPKIKLEVRYNVFGWCELMTAGGLTTLVEHADAPDCLCLPELEGLPVGESAAAAARAASTTMVPLGQPTEEVERYKAALRSVTHDGDGVPWCRRFEKHDRDSSGLLSAMEFYRCIRRYCMPSLLSDHDIASLRAAVDADGSGEISIEEFEIFLHAGGGYKAENKAAASIQARWRGRKAREADSYRKSVRTLEARADAQVSVTTPVTDRHMD